MIDQLTIALDAMGGDNAPNIVVEGAQIARERYPDVRFLFFGVETVVRPLVEADPALAEISELIHTDKIVRGEDKPSSALRHGKNSSMGLAIEAVNEGRAQVALSAGNTGALMALAKFRLRMMPGIERPALAALIPTVRGESVMLDLGANVDCSAKHLVQFAVMGGAFAQSVLGLDVPSVGLLNVGSEELKGNDNVRDAAQALRAAHHLPIGFTGFVEGDGICGGAVDVVVADGFTGNVALKTAEGMARMMRGLLGNAFKSTMSSRVGYLMARPALRSMREHLDPNNRNGAVLLGLNGLVVKSHGGAGAAGFATAVGLAVDMARHHLTDQIASYLADLPSEDEASGDTIAVATAGGAC